MPRILVIDYDHSLPFLALPHRTLTCRTLTCLTMFGW